MTGINRHISGAAPERNAVDLSMLGACIHFSPTLRQRRTDAHAAATNFAFQESFWPMVRLTLNICGILILAAAFAVLVIDATRSLAAGRLIVTLLSQTAITLAPGKFALLEAIADRHVHPLLAPVFVNLLRLPTSLASGALGALLFWLARKPKPNIGFSSR
jgi:hypothetical protein